MTEAHFSGATLAKSLLGGGASFEQVANPTLEAIPQTVLVFVGMSFEAEIAAGPGVLVFSRDRRQDLARAAENAARRGYRGIISFGVAGGLVTSLRAGDCVVASAVVDSKSTRATDKSWSKRLCDALPTAHYGSIIGVDCPVTHPPKKRELHRTTGAAAVDMESHVVADLAATHGLAFAAVRVIVDPAHRAIPSSALRGMNIGPGGRVNGLAVWRDLMARPSQLPLLLRVSLDAYIARSEMLRVRQLLGPDFGLTGLAAREEVAQPNLAEELAVGEVASYRTPA